MIRVAIPSKGRLMDKTADWFAARGLTLTRKGSDREYAVRFAESETIQPVLLSAGEIPGELAIGRVHFGVTGSDLIHERVANPQDQVAAIAQMGFGHADLILAVPACWHDVDCLDDLDAVAAQFRQNHGFRLRIATKYHRMVRTFLRRHGVADYQLVTSQGATEGTVANKTAEAIADITSTGATLEANHLKILSDGLIHASQATLFQSLQTPVSAKQKPVLDAFIQQMQAR